MLTALVAAVAVTQPASAQTMPVSLGGSALGVASDPVFVGLGTVLRASVDRQVRMRVGAWAGRRGRATAGRAEAVMELVLDPGTAGWSPFAGGGFAVAVDRRDAEAYLVVSVGLEQRPAGRSGWWFETGLGAGVRVGLGYRVAISPARRPTR
jgi:hypothetical protein